MNVLVIRTDGLSWLKNDKTVNRTVYKKKNFENIVMQYIDFQFNFCLCSYFEESNGNVPVFCLPNSKYSRTFHTAAAITFTTKQLYLTFSLFIIKKKLNIKKIIFFINHTN